MSDPDPVSNNVGKQVDVYRNLNHGGYSLRSRETETYGTVIEKVDCVLVEDAEFVVHESGRQRVLEEGKKNVHAVVRGVVAEPDRTTEMDTSHPVTYDPYEYSHFVHEETEEPIEKAELVLLSSSGVTATRVTYAD